MCHANQTDVPATRTPKSPWRRFLRQPVRPRLPRKVVPSARINLNRYWTKFEEVTSVNKPSSALHSLLTNAADDNAINDNLVNEMTEIGNLSTK